MSRKTTRTNAFLPK